MNETLLKLQIEAAEKKLAKLKRKLNQSRKNFTYQNYDSCVERSEDIQITLQNNTNIKYTSSILEIMDNGDFADTGFLLGHEKHWTVEKDEGGYLVLIPTQENLI